MATTCHNQHQKPPNKPKPNKTSWLPSLPQIHPSIQTYTLPNKKKNHRGIGRGSLITLGGVLGKVKTSSKKSRFTGEGPGDGDVDVRRQWSMGWGKMAIDNGGKTGETHPPEGLGGNFGEMVNQASVWWPVSFVFFIMGMGILCEKSSRIDAWKFINNL